MHSSFLVCQKHVYESLHSVKQSDHANDHCKMQKAREKQVGIHYSSIRPRGTECASSHIPQDTPEGSVPSCFGHSPWGKQINMPEQKCQTQRPVHTLGGKDHQVTPVTQCVGSLSTMFRRACWAPCLVLHVLTSLAIRLVNGVR